jgi:hypothetical protein
MEGWVHLRFLASNDTGIIISINVPFFFLGSLLSRMLIHMPMLTPTPTPIPIRMLMLMLILMLDSINNATLLDASQVQRCPAPPSQQRKASLQSEST